MRLIPCCLFALLCCLPVAPLFADESQDELELQQETALPPSGEEFEWLRSAQPDTVICPFRQQIRYQPGEIECGLIQVPENREVAGSRTLELHYVRLRARGKDAEGNSVEIRDDPVIYLTGGPGVTVSGYVAKLKDHGLLAQRDLYILEQRGIGYSGDFCPFFDTRNRAQHIHDNYLDQQLSQLDAARSCAEIASAQGVDLRGYHTFENARDVRALRMALGLETWNVWGISYGSALGQAMVRVDPEGVRAMVIDAIVPLDLSELMRIASWYSRVLDKLFAACDAQRSCTRAWPDLRERYMAAIATVAETPITLKVQPSERYPQGELSFFQDLIAGLPFSLMYEQSTHAAIPALMAAMADSVERGEHLPFQAIAQIDRRGGFSVSPGMSMAVRCLDGYVEHWAREADAEYAAHPLLASAFSSRELIDKARDFCADLGLPARDPAGYLPQTSTVPTLIANGAWDPITPPPLVDHVLPMFSNGRYVEFPHAGHGPTRSLPCAGKFLNAFFDDPQGELDMSCVEAGEQAAVFINGHYASSAVARAVLMLDDDRKALVRHLLWGAGSLLLVLLGVLVLPAAALVRRLDGRAEAGAELRLLLFLAALSALLWALGMGLAGWRTSELTPALLLFGMLPWAACFAWLAPLAALLAILALAVMYLQRASLQRGTLLGFIPLALACISVSLFALTWDLWP